jgi:PKD repeat protein
VAILTGAEDPASTFTYDFGDTTTAGPTTDHTQPHTYSRRGTYQVRVTRTSDFNQGACTVTAQGIIKVTAVPNTGLIPLNSIITVTDAEGTS